MFLSRARNVLSGLVAGQAVCNGGALSELKTVLIREWMLLLLGLVLAGDWAGAAEITSAKGGSTNELTVEQFDQLRANRDLVVLDLRKADDYFRGHIPDAINMDCTEKDFAEKLAALDRHHGYLLHARTESGADEVWEKLMKLHFKQVYRLQGGFDAWQTAGKPVEKAGVPKPGKN